MDVRVWQSASSRDAADKQKEPAGTSSEAPTLSLRIGRHDRLKKTIYAQVEGDHVILTLPDTLLEVLPRNQYAFRDRGVLAISAAGITRLTVMIQDAKTTVLEPDSSGKAPTAGECSNR